MNKLLSDPTILVVVFLLGLPVTTGCLMLLGWGLQQAISNVIDHAAALRCVAS